MKKTTIVSAVSFIFLLVSSAVAKLTAPLLSDALVALSIGGGLLLASGILALAVRDFLPVNILCIVLSSISMGVLIRAWYINRGFDNSFPVLCIVSIFAVLYLWVYFALSKIPIFRSHKGARIAFTLCYFALSGIAYLTVMLNTDTTYVSTFGYYMLIEMAFIFAYVLEVNDYGELVRNLTLSTYSVFVVGVIVAVFVVIAALGGDGLDCDADCCCDGCEFDFRKNKNKQKKK